MGPDRTTPDRMRPDRMRVEELARRADVSVDTIRFYQKRRLLPPPERAGRVAWYGAEHRARLERIKQLQCQGLSLDVIRRLLSGELDPADEPLAEAVAESRDDGQPGLAQLLTLDELAERASVPGPLVEAVVREGLLVPRHYAGRPCFTTDDLHVVDAAMQLLQAGLPMPELLALSRRHNLATRETAEAAVAMFDEHIRQPIRAGDLPTAEKAEQLVGAFRTLLPAVTTLVAHHFRRVLLEIAQAHLDAVGEPAELAAARAESDAETTSRQAARR